MSCSVNCVRRETDKVPLDCDVVIDYVRFCFFRANAVCLSRVTQTRTSYSSKLWLRAESPFYVSVFVVWVT
jgi:hypothetical protein